MERKPLGVLFSEFVKDEFAKIGLASMDKIIHKKGFGFIPSLHKIFYTMVFLSKGAI